MHLMTTFLFFIHSLLPYLSNDNSKQDAFSIPGSFLLYLKKTYPYQPLVGEDKGGGEDVDKSSLFTSKSHTTSLNPSQRGREVIPQAHPPRAGFSF
jgi:hypothetical protein